MRKITDFVINKRHFILILFIILTIIAGVLSTKVKINHDIAKYLPSTSETRIGMDIMEEEFAGTETSTLNLMFEDLQEDKTKIKEDLEKIDGVEEVDYDDTEDYNKENYTLYVITVDDKSDSEMATEVYNKVAEKYKDYTFYTSGDVSETNKSVLPIWIIVLAVICALIILIIMCESYVEPFLFLTSILMAVALNKGTNIIFDNVSHITNSIAAILQMALSMDYSIMLMNRYDQEKETEKDKVKAMKNALYKAFQAISSSSVTTIVGLLALIFMTFRIGRDLGFVLAKGVLFSLICIFFVLPDLILIFDKWITKTKKKSPEIKLNKLGAYSYKIRYIAVPLFIFIFVSSFLLKGNLGIDYTDTESDEITEVFSENNQIAILYKNEDEQKVAEYLKELENKEKVDEVLAYGNTINEKLTYDKLNDKLNDLGSTVNVEDYLLKIVYFDYYNPEKNNTITFEEFIDFIENEAYNNEKTNKKIEDKTKKDIRRLKNFVTEKNMNEKKTASEIAEILEIGKDQIDDIFTYYLSKNNQTKITLNEFVSFMNKDVLTNEKYSVKVDGTAKEKLKTLSKFIDKEKMQKKMTEQEIADLFGIDKTNVEELFRYYNLVNSSDTKMTISEFSKFVLNDVITNEEYSGSFNEETIQNLKMLETFSNSETINTKMNIKELSLLFGIDERNINVIYMLSGLPLDDITTWEVTPNEFVKLILENENLKNSIDVETLGKLELLSTIMTSTINDTKYSYQEMAQIIGIDEANIKNIYTLYTIEKENTKLSPNEFVNFVLEHKNDEMLAGSIQKDTINDLNLIKAILDGVINNKKYSSSELTTLLSLNREDVDLLYGLYSFKYINTNPSLSLREFVGFLLNDVITNKEYSSNFDEEKTSKLNTVNKIMENSLKNVKYTSDEILAIIGKLSNSVESSTVKALYTYYGSDRQYDNSWEMTVEEFVKFLNENILQDERFTDFIEDDMRNDIIEAKTTIQDARDLLIGDNYSRIVLNTSLSPESEETFGFIQKIKDELGEKVENFYVIGDSPMAYEISGTFDKELNFMTIITMLAIFIVVAITFKSAIIPAILVLTIQTAVYLIMGVLSLIGENVYFIAILIVQSILMGATIDYAILYTSYYLEHRKTKSIKESIIDSYNKSIHTILTSSSILIIVTLIIANFASAIAAKICKTISEGTICSTILILMLLPAVLAFCDRIIVKNKKEKI